ncbi:MAG: tyrosine-type recombinase/integrase [Candidatus Bathyarchaeia archaeon]
MSERSFIAFIDSQHSLNEQTKRGYKLAVRRFEGIALKKFEECYLNYDIIHAVLAKLDEQLEDSTWNLCLQRYQRLAKWLFDPDDDDCPKLWRKIEPKKIDWNKKLKDKWLTEEEFYSLLDVVDHPRDKAFFAVATEGGLRPGEVLGINIGDCKAVEYGFTVMVSGKTGTRSVPIVLFASLLRNWLNHHPLKHDKDAPLWVQRIGVSYQRVSYSTMNRWHFKRYCAAAKIYRWKTITKFVTGKDGVRREVTKSINAVSLHYLRHTKMTWTAKNRKVKITTKQANLMFGWSPNSNMFNRYSHLAGSDSEDAFLDLAGVERVKGQADKPSVLLRQKCLNCGELNGAGSMYCFRCGCPLSEVAAQALVDKRRMEEDFMRMQPMLMELWREKQEKEATERAKKQTSL